MFLEGAISVKSAIFNAKRIINIVYIDKAKDTRDFRFIINELKKRKIPFKRLNRNLINQMAEGTTHGGIIADVESRFYSDINSIKDKVVFMIDGVEDPFNIGYMMRTLKAFGYNDVILPKRDYSNMEATIQKSSAGAFDAMNVILSEDYINDISKIKNNYKIFALARNDEAKNIFSYDYDDSNKIIIIGGEKRGINKELMSLVDESLYIEYPGDFRNALNAYAALDVVVTVLEMRKKK